MNYQQQAAQKKPIAAAILSIVAGVIGLIMSLVAVVGILYAMTLIGGSGYGFGFFGDILAIAVGVAIWILIASILVLVGGTKIYSRPTEHKKWGVIILVFSIIGLLLLSGTELTGIVGLLAAIMGIIGGILSLAFKPSPTQQTYIPQQPYAQTGYPPPPPQATYQQQQQLRGVCPQCGQALQPGVKFCPNCGKPLT